jgi:hypothetical protein
VSGLLDPALWAVVLVCVGLVGLAFDTIARTCRHAKPQHHRHNFETEVAVAAAYVLTGGWLLRSRLDRVSLGLVLYAAGLAVVLEGTRWLHWHQRVMRDRRGP